MSQGKQILLLEKFFRAKIERAFLQNSVKVGLGSTFINTPSLFQY